jgi:ATP phosphoribosyltransferase
MASAGIRPAENPETSRRLIIGTNREDVSIIIVRLDVPTMCVMAPPISA